MCGVNIDAFRAKWQHGRWAYYLCDVIQTAGGVDRAGSEGFFSRLNRAIELSSIDTARGSNDTVSRLVLTHHRHQVWYRRTVGLPLFNKGTQKPRAESYCLSRFLITIFYSFVLRMMRTLNKATMEKQQKHVKK